MSSKYGQNIAGFNDFRGAQTNRKNGESEFLK